MTLLKTNLNSALRNYDFEKKIVGDGRKKGIKAYSSLDVANEVVTSYENGNAWTENVIRNRTKKLCGEFKNIWPS